MLVSALAVKGVTARGLGLAVRKYFASQAKDGSRRNGKRSYSTEADMFRSVGTYLYPRLGSRL